MSREQAALQARIRSRIASRRERLANLTQALVRIESETPPSATGPMAEAVADILRATPGFDVRIRKSEPPVVNLTARLTGGKPGPRLLFSGHLDTYPIGDRAGWAHDPLGGEISDGRLYGRGSADMKGGLAALIVAAEAFAAEAESWPGEIVLAFAGDEESMGRLGTQRLLETASEMRADGVLVGDVGAPQVPRCGEKGMVWLTLTARGRAAHGAHVHRGINAIERLMAALEALRGLERTPIETPSDASATIAAARMISEPIGGDGEADILRRITVNVGRIEGGMSANLVPDHARAEVDIRLPLGASVASVAAAIEAALAPLEGVDYEITRRYEPSWTSPRHPLVAAVVEAAETVLAKPCAPNMRVGASDARLFRAEQMPTVVLGLTPYNLGGPDENLVVAELAHIAEIYGCAAARFLCSSA